MSNKMMARSITSFFTKKGGGGSSEPEIVQIPTRRMKKAKKPKVKVEVEVQYDEDERTVSEEEDPLPRKHRNKQNKRKAKVLSDSEDEEEEEEEKKKKKKKKSKDDKKKGKEEVKPVKKEKKEEPKKSVDPMDFFSTQKVKQEKKVVKGKDEVPGPSSASKYEAKAKTSSPTRSSPRKIQRLTSPEKKEVEEKRQERKSPKVENEDLTKSPQKKKKYKNDSDVDEDFSPKGKAKSPEKSPKKKKELAKSLLDDSESEEDFDPKRKTSSKSRDSAAQKSPRKSRSPTKHKQEKEEEEEELESDSETKKRKGKGRGKGGTQSSPGKSSKVRSLKEKKSKSPKKNADGDENGEQKKKKSSFNFAKYQAHLAMKPKNYGQKRIPKGAPGCLKGKTFVMTGILDSLERDTAEDLIVKYGGRVTSSVSRKTTYLIVGVDPGESKTKQADKLRIPMIEEDGLLDIIRKSMPDQPDDEEIEMMEIAGDEFAVEEPVVKTEVKKEEDEDVKQPGKKSKKGSKSPEKRPPSKTEPQTKVTVSTDLNANEPSKLALPKPVMSPNLMWVDKYKPKMIKHVVGQQREGSNAHRLVTWLKNWFKHHGKADDKAKAANPFQRDPEGKSFKCALLSGPPGIGKTTTAHLACLEVAYDYFELNASDTRNKKGLHETVTDCLSNRTMFHKSNVNDLTRKHVLIMDEVDGMSGNEDRGGVQELIQLIRNSRVPIICICNDRNHPKIRSLANYCFDLRFAKPTLQELKGFISSVCFKEGMKLDPQRVTQLCESTDQDIRQILHQLELYKESNAAKVLDPKKDLRFGPWDVCRKVFHKGEHDHMNIHEKNSLFFQDYSIGPLFVQENYPRWRPARAKSDPYARLELLSRAAASIADGELTETLIRRTNNWSLLPIQAVLSSYIPGELMESDVCGAIEFPQWLGKNSNKGKRHRLLQALHTHVHLGVSGSLEALNMDYLPYMRRKICDPLIQGNTDDATEFMESYTLLRDDVDSIMDLSLWPGMKNPWEKVDTKVKTAFTKRVNKEILPYSTDKPVAKRRGKDVSDEYGVEEEVAEESEEETPEKDGMIKMKNRKSKKEQEPEPGPSKPKKKRK